MNDHEGYKRAEPMSPQLPSTGGAASLRHPAVADHELIRVIGRGSYGEVWLARNIMGAYRAVKVVYRRTFNSQKPYEREFQGIKRFEPVSRSHESQLDILHVGRGEDCFYYIMELGDDQARGQEIDPENYFPKTLRNQLVVQGRMTPRECVEVALGLATALEHLHSHGLAHRDVKPSNIVFVNGLPKLADIGLVADVDATVSFVGTEGYLPPEGPGSPQADIYSLGKVLYEMATGRDRQDFPELPTQFETAPDGPDLAELNEIILRACQPDARKRYQSAAEMRRDLEVLHSGHSVARLRVTERRLRRAKHVGVAATAIALLAGGAFVFQARQTERAFQISEREGELRRSAEQALLQAETESARSTQVARFLREMLSGVGPSVALGRDTTLLREILDRTAERLGELANQPAVEADLRVTLGNVFFEIGDYQRAEEMQRRALEIRKSLHGERHPEVADSLSFLGEALFGLGRYGLAAELHQQALDLRRELHGEAHPDVAASLHRLTMAVTWATADRGPESEKRWREAVELRRKTLGSDHLETAETLYMLAMALWHGDDRDVESEELFNNVLRIRRAAHGDEHPDVAHALDGLALPLTTMSRFEEAEDVLNEALAMRLRLQGENHPQLAFTYDSLGRLRFDQRRHEEAEEFFRKGLALREQLGRMHSEYFDSLHWIGHALVGQERYAEAEAIYREGLEVLLEIEDLEKQRLGFWLHILGDVLLPQQKHSEAEEFQRKAVELLREAGTKNLMFLARALHSLARNVSQQGRHSEAADIRKECSGVLRQLGKQVDLAAVLTLLSEDLSRAHDHTGAKSALDEAIAILRNCHEEVRKHWRALGQVGRMLLNHARFEEAEELLRWSIHLVGSLTCPDRQEIPIPLARLAVALYQQGEDSEAEQIRLEIIGLLRENASNTSAALGLLELGDCLSALRKHAEAEEVIRRELQIRREMSLAGAGRIDGALRRLGRSLMRQGKYTEAEPLLREAWDLEVGADETKAGSQALPLLVVALIGQDRHDEAKSLLDGDELAFHRLHVRKLIDREDWTGAEAVWRENLLELTRASIPPRLSGLSDRHIDLTPFLNGRFDSNWHFDMLSRNDLASLPTGLQEFAGVPFDVRGLIQLGRRLKNHHLSDENVGLFPEQVSGIPVNRYCRLLHFLHSAVWGGEDPKGTKVGAYMIHYDDGEQSEIPILIDVHVQEWHQTSRAPSEELTVAWEGKNSAGITVRLFKSTWLNPRSDSKIARIDLIGAGKQAAPFLVAITAE
jgi:tetratricopeptide (TPR) repeat protein